MSEIEQTGVRVVGNVIPFTGGGECVVDSGRGTSEGQGASGQLAENHCNVRSSRPTWMSAPASIAASFLPSLHARELTVDKPTPSSSAYEWASFNNDAMLVILPLSVSLPAMSTAILPDATGLSSGHATDMDLPTILANIEARLKQGNLKADAVSISSGHPDAIRNLRRSVKSGKGGMTTRTLNDIAKALNCHAADLMLPPAPAATLPVGDPDTLRAFLVAQRDLIDRQIKALDNAEAARNMGKNTPRRKKR